LPVGPVGALGALGAAVFWLSPLVPGQPAREFAFGPSLVALWLLLIALSLACWRRGHVTLGLVCGSFSVPAFVASLLTAVASSSPTVSESPGALVRALLFAGGGVALTLGTAAIAQRLAQLRPEAAPALASTLLLVVMAGVHLPIVTPSAESAISPALLDLGRRATEQIGEGEVAYAVTTPAIAEWFERAALGRQRTPQLTTYDRWYVDLNGPEFLLLTSQPPTDARTEVLLRSPNATLLRREAETMAGAPVSDAQYPRVVPLGDGPQLVLVGFDVGERYEPGDVIRVTAHLAVNPRGLGRYRLTIRLVGRDGRAYGESEQQVSLARSPGRQVTRVQFDIPAAGNAPGGLYDLELTVARQPSGELLTPHDGGAKGDRIALGMVRVLRQGEAGSQVTATPPQPLRATFTNGLTLYGYGLSQREVRAGAAVTLDLYWLPERQIDRDYAIVVFFLDQNDHVLATDELQPLLGRYPTTAWLPGERVRDQRRLRVPENLPESRVRLALGVVEPVSRVYDHDVTSGQSVIPFAPLVVEPAE
ncbi:MAG: hypothetical protein HY329_24395, partial [Chloroflexi bacterium]|nr:hypothetical protein [Chloroflexota bacterium]